MVFSRKMNIGGTYFEVIKNFYFLKINFCVEEIMSLKSIFYLSFKMEKEGISEFYLST